MSNNQHHFFISFKNGVYKNINSLITTKNLRSFAEVTILIIFALSILREQTTAKARGKLVG